MNMLINTKKKPLVVALSMALLAVSQSGFANDWIDPISHPLRPTHSTSNIVLAKGETIDGQKAVGVGLGYSVYHGKVQKSSFTKGSQLSLLGVDFKANSPVADNAHSENNTFQDNSHAIIQYGKSVGDNFTDTAAQFLGNPSKIASDNEAEKSTAVRGTFNKGAYQSLESDSSASDSHFNDDSTQWLTDNASSINNEFTGNSIQILVPTKKTENEISPVSKVDRFRGASKQYAENAGEINSASFTDQAGQEMIGNASSNESNFSGHSTQSVWKGAESNHDSFTDNAIQTVHNGGVAIGANFSGSSALILEDGSESENATFYDNASGMVANKAIMSGTTTMNNGSVLTALAGTEVHLEAPQIQSLVINDDARLNILNAGNGSGVNSELTTGSIIMNGGTIQFGHESGTDHYSTLSADSVTGTGGHLIMNGNLANHHSDMLSTEAMSGKYQITLNNQDSGREIAGEGDLHGLIQISDDEGAEFTLTTINPDTGKPTPNNPDNHGTDQG
ncbi:pertactin-like passenger domain-containing protein, partial [Serratia liquefaciens]|uniref:pertactin-like passenger domain-containing protein n=1 Tax=Serratia liquefaciens TaxID=614 RepID=UPI003906BC80